MAIMAKMAVAGVINGIGSESAQSIKRRRNGVSVSAGS
jgi:hypothetical protein